MSSLEGSEVCTASSGWDRPILTDSGGYQVFSLAERRRITEDGAEFQSHLDGSLHHLTPESAVDIQARLGSDIAMVLDECLAYPATREQAAESMQRSVRWAARCRSRLEDLRSSSRPDVIVSNAGQAQFGIVQGGTFPGPALRERRSYEGHRLRGICDRRPERRGADRPHVRHRRRDHATAT